MDKVKLVKHPVKGRCVIAIMDFKDGELIDSNPVIDFPIATGHKIFDQYAFEWLPGENCIALGFISLLNYSKTPNCSVKNDFDNKLKLCYAVKDIRAW